MGAGTGCSGARLSQSQGCDSHLREAQLGQGHWPHGQDTLMGKTSPKARLRAEAGAGQCPGGRLKEGSEPGEVGPGCSLPTAAHSNAPCPAEPLLPALGGRPRTENSQAPGLQHQTSRQSELGIGSRPCPDS